VKQTLRPGAELELLTREELRGELRELEQALARRPAVVRAEKSFETDANGDASASVYKVPLGMAFRLSRVLVQLDGFTAAVPFNGAGAYLEVRRNDVMVDFLSLVAGAAGGGSLPAKLDTESDSSAAWFANGDDVVVVLESVTASRSGVVRIQGLLEPVVLGN
jgi:hypothetical protein